MYIAHGVNYATPDEKTKMADGLIEHLKKYF